MSASRNIKHIRIGELSARSGFSVHTIRWYESQGLMPGVTRDLGSRRVYTERHIGWLGLVERLRTTGMTIAQIRDYAKLIRGGSSSIGAQQAMLVAHRQHVLAMMVEWQDALELLDEKIAFYDQWLRTGARPTEEVQKPKRRTSRPPVPRKAQRPLRSTL